MATSMSFNPMQTTVAAGGFNIDSLGYQQGVALDSPSIRNELAGGQYDPAATLPIWGGVAIYEDVPVRSPYNAPSLGGKIGRATTIDATSATGLAGWCVWNQAHHAINSPQSPAPLFAAGMSVHYYRLKSGARIPVACNPSLVSLQGGAVGAQVSWDFLTQRLQPYTAAETYAVSSMVWASTNGGRITVVMTDAVPFGLGDTITIAGATNAGTGGAAAINKSFVIDTYTDTTHFTLAAPAAAGVFGAIAGSPVVDTSVGALPVRVLDVQVGNSMVLEYDSVTGFATWNRNGTVAVILI